MKFFPILIRGRNENKGNLNREKGRMLKKQIWKNLKSEEQGHRKHTSDFA